MNIVNGLIWYSTKVATVGLVVVAGVVVDCPPYAVRWAKGRNARQVWIEAARQGADLVWLPDEGQEEVVAVRTNRR